MEADAPARLSLTPREGWLLLAAFLPRLACAALFGERGDDMVETTIALNFLNGQGLSIEWAPGVIRTAWLPPGFPVLLVPYIKLFGENWLPFRIGMALLGALTAWALYRAARPRIGETAALIAGWALALYPPQIFWSSRMNPRSLATALLVFFWWAFLRFLRPPAARAGVALALGLGWGVLCLFRGEYLPAAGLIAAWLLWTQAPRSRGVLLAAVFLAGTSAALSPWLIRNWRIHHRLVIATNAGDNLFHAFNPTYDFSGVTPVYWEDEGLRKVMTERSEAELQDYFLQRISDYVRSNPWVVPKTLGGNFLHFWRPYLSPGAVPWSANLAFTAGYLLVFVFFVAALFRTRWSDPAWALAGGLIAYQCLSHLPFYVVVHFREMIAPFMILAAAPQAARLLRKKTR